jgi:transketolase
VSRERAFLESSNAREEFSPELRLRVLEILGNSGRGHLGPALSVMDIIDALYESVLEFDPRNSNWKSRDRFILSKGHGCLGLYVVLEKFGFFDKQKLNDFCSFNSWFGGHPESATNPGVEFSTGSLGHGLSFGVGLSIAARIKKEKWRTFVLLGDGELNEGSVWEAAAHADKHQLSNLCLIVDYNKMQASGSSQDVLDLGSLQRKFEAFGFRVLEVDGHRKSDLAQTLNFDPSQQLEPLAVIAHTTKGKGVPLAENSSFWHHKAKITRDEIAELKASIAK